MPAPAAETEGESPAGAGQPPPGAPLVWVDWPLAARPGLGLAVLLLIVALTLGVRYALASAFFSALCLLVLTLAVAPFYLPARYVLDEYAVTVAGLLGRRSRPWSALRAYYRDGQRGILVSSITKYGLLARTRGLYLRCSGNHLAVLALVAARLAPGETRPRPPSA